ncbi:hypothetical protein V6N13_122026 [Hibiscus sabdariffa]|uniref:Uncharacterized protein n=2 Tax=Hibiscus sabdariffa TaxID=183260 RepID=A0ABR2C8L1_9ROSI
MRTYQLRPQRARNEAAAAVEAAGNEASAVANIGAAGGGNGIIEETKVALYTDLVEEVKGLTNELNVARFQNMNLVAERSELNTLIVLRTQYSVLSVTEPCDT